MTEGDMERVEIVIMRTEGCNNVISFALPLLRTIEHIRQ